MDLKDPHRRTFWKGIVKSVTFLLLLIVQIWWIVYLIMRIEGRHPWLTTVITYVAVGLALSVYFRRINSSMKLMWIMLIHAFPILGACLYLLMGRRNVTAGMLRRFQKADALLQNRLTQDEAVAEQLRFSDPHAYRASTYLLRYGGYPVLRNTDVTYYDDALQAFNAQLEALRGAKRFIFMEYLAIEDAVCFELVADLLKEKAKEGVHVRLIYDDVGSVVLISKKFMRELQKEGVDCRVFNPIMPFLNVFMNNRDHRKITVVDGEVAFTGGYNIASEYFHEIEPYGFWKDTGVRMTGDAVSSLTAMFLQMWNGIAMSDTEKDIASFFPAVSYRATESGFVQPFADSPLDEERVGEETYMNLLRGATRYAYFVTPYLVITDEMREELIAAAKRDIDVRIITPGIPDKKLIYQLTRSYYAALIAGGVRIYEYTPGFVHAKMSVSDDRICTVGTFNLDFRSLYLHFENGVFFSGGSIIQNVRQDFDTMFDVSRLVTDDDVKNRSVPVRILQGFLRLFAPLM